MSLVIDDARLTTLCASGFEGYPVKTCPACGYSLEGLPRRHCCPECAFEYDESTRCWRPSRFFDFARTSLLGFMIVTASALLMETTAWITPLRRQYLMAGLSIWLVTIVRDMLTYRNRPFVATTSKGVVYRTGRDQHRFIEWRMICGLERRKVGARTRLWLRLHDQGRAIELSSMFARGQAVDCFAILVERHVGTPALLDHLLAGNPT
jgi:hypothetical protein